MADDNMNGTNFLLLGPTYIGRSNMGAPRQAEFSAAFDRAVSVAIDEQVDAVLQVGTLFGAQSVSSQYLTDLHESLRRLKDVGITFCHVPSERDGQMPEVTKLEENGLVHELSSEPTVVGDVAIAGIRPDADRSQEWSDITFPASSSHNIVASHDTVGSLAEGSAPDYEELQQLVSGTLDAVVVGDHETQDVYTGSIDVFAPGFIEPLLGKWMYSENSRNPYPSTVTQLQCSDGKVNYQTHELDHRRLLVIEVTGGSASETEAIWDKLSETEYDGTSVLLLIRSPSDASQIASVIADRINETAFSLYKWSETDSGLSSTDFDISMQEYVTTSETGVITGGDRTTIENNSVLFPEEMVQDFFSKGAESDAAPAVAEAFVTLSEQIGEEFAQYDWVDSLIWDQPSPGSPYVGPRHTSRQSTDYLWLGMAHESMASLGRPTKGLQLEFGVDADSKTGLFGRDVLCGIHINRRTGDSELKHQLAERLRSHSELFASFLSNNDRYVLYLGENSWAEPTAKTIEKNVDALSDGFLLTADLTAANLVEVDDIASTIASHFQQLLPYYGALIEVDDFGVQTSSEPPWKANELEQALQSKPQVILYGPPGTGKTYAATEFARWWTSNDYKSDFETVTFHPSVSYEDFVEGFAPQNKADGAIQFELEDGLFKQMATTAREHYEADPTDPGRHVLVVDELNRGDVASVFGELVTVLEGDKRGGAFDGLSVKLSHSGDEFVVPPNLYVIGTMNTADRSISLLDAAIRRRFNFIQCTPDFDIVRKASDKDSEVGKLVVQSADVVEQVNEQLRNDLGRGKQIGHAYLLGIESTEELRNVWRYNILPLLDEFYYEQFDRLRNTVFEGSGELFFDWEYQEIRSFDVDDLRTELKSFR